MTSGYGLHGPGPIRTGSRMHTVVAAPPYVRRQRDDTDLGRLDRCPDRVADLDAECGEAGRRSPRPPGRADRPIGRAPDHQPVPLRRRPSARRSEGCPRDGHDGAPPRRVGPSRSPGRRAASWDPTCTMPPPSIVSTPSVELAPEQVRAHQVGDVRRSWGSRRAATACPAA